MNKKAGDLDPTEPSVVSGFHEINLPDLKYIILKMEYSKSIYLFMFFLKKILKENWIIIFFKLHIFILVNSQFHLCLELELR
jgi:hypothetical protein